MGANQPKYSSWIISLSVLFLSGCIEQYYPEKDELKPGTLVVLAHLTSKPGMQFIHISRSSAIIYPKYDPLSYCYIEVVNLGGDSKEFRETEPGRYCCQLDETFLHIGEAYRLEIITPEGSRYASGYETIYPVPEIQSIYFARENHATRDLEIIEEGIQFYMDFEVEKDSGRFLRWNLVETYEIHNPDNEAWIYDVDRRLKIAPDSITWRRCWISRELPEIYTLDVGNVDGEIYRRFPLNFVSNETRRLHIRYCLQVEQLALSQAAFFYWDELRKNIQSQGNLFDTQAALTHGNICNVNDQKEAVIGYFSISSLHEKRVFVDDVPDLDFQIDPYYCAPGDFPPFLSRINDKYLPYYMVSARVEGIWRTGEVHKYCVDCRDYKGSSHIKPEFW